jgi:hypothetical protein
MNNVSSNRFKKMEFNSVKTDAKNFVTFKEKCQTYFYLKIHIETLDITYKQCDDFGTIFKPFLELKIIGQEAFKINTIDEEKINLSCDLSNISNDQESSKYDRMKSFISMKSNNNEGVKDKKYTFKTVNFLLISE